MIVLERIITGLNEVYEMLRKTKLSEESFNDVTMRLNKGGGSLLDIVGSNTVTEEGWKMLIKYRELANLADLERRKRILKLLDNQYVL